MTDAVIVIPISKFTNHSFHSFTLHSISPPNTAAAGTFLCNSS